MSYVVNTITKADGVTNVKGPLINLTFNDDVSVAKVPGENNIEISVKKINKRGRYPRMLVFSISDLVSIGGVAPETDINDLLDQIITEMP